MSVPDSLTSSSALVILSGGQDSVTSLYWAKHEFNRVAAISFVYGQKHQVEMECAAKVCELTGVTHKIVDISFLPDLVESALTDHGDVSQYNKKGLPASFVPNRNQLFITLAHAYAQKIGFDNLVTGVCQTDYSGYPDCRLGYIRAIEHASNMGSESKISIHTPIMHIDKAETFALAWQLGCLEVVLEHSHTCYNGDRSVRHEWGYGCGECPACLLRKKGWEEYQLQVK